MEKWKKSKSILYIETKKLKPRDNYLKIYRVSHFNISQKRNDLQGKFNATCLYSVSRFLCKNISVIKMIPLNRLHKSRFSKTAMNYKWEV